MYERWFGETVRLLELAGYLQRDRERLRSMIPHRPISRRSGASGTHAKQAWLADSDQKAPVVLVEHCLRALPDVLTGKCKATDIMFPDGAMDLVQGIYKDNVVADYFNEVLGDTAVA